MRALALSVDYNDEMLRSVDKLDVVLTDKIEFCFARIDHVWLLPSNESMSLCRRAYPPSDRL